MERKNIILIVAIVLIAVGIFVVKKFLSTDSGCPKLVYSISASSILAGESIHFEDNTTISNDWKWEFGDGGTSDAQNGDYTYKNAGDYTITLTINGKCSETTTIKVGELNISSNDTMQKAVAINGPSSCKVGDVVQFNNATEGATKWEWQFGETGSNDKFEQNASYTYSSPGTYTIVLRVDASKAEGRHKIIVTSKPNTGGGAPPAKITGPQLKAKFELITQGSYEAEYYSLLKKYFCNNSGTLVIINGDKNANIYNYCMKLDIQRNTKISDVQVEYDNTTNCISKVTVTQK